MLTALGIVAANLFALWVISQDNNRRR